MNRAILRTTLLVLLASFPLATFAFTYNEYKPIDSTERTLLIAFGAFGSLANYVCGLDEHSCTATTTKSFSKNSDLPFGSEQLWYGRNKSVAIYRTLEKTTAEVTTRYFFAQYTTGGWSTGKQLSITDDILKWYWPKDAQNEVLYLTKENARGARDLVRFNLVDNREVARKTITESITNGTVSPDDQWFAYYVPMNQKKGNIKSTVLLHMLPGAITEYRYDYTVPKNWELLTDANRLFTFSPDSAHFAFLEDSAGAPVARLADLSATSSPLGSALSVGKETLSTVADVWFPDNDTLLVVGNDQHSLLDWLLYLYDIKAKNINIVAPDVSYMYEMEQYGDRVVLGKMLGPNLVPFLYDPKTRHAYDFVLPTATADPAIVREVVHLKNGFDGVVIKNKHTKITAKTPMVVWLHGGPFRQISKGYQSYPSYAVYDWMLDQLVLGGALVLKVDYSGSYGYGNDGTYRIVDNVGKQDVSDVRSAVNEVKKKLKFKGPVYLEGNSYGGYLGPRALVAYPDEFSGAIAINGVFEWRTLLQYLRNSIFNTHLDGLYDPEHPERYEKASITSRLKSLPRARKVVIIHGMADTTINPDQAYTFYELLKNAGKNAKIVSIPEEDHIFSKASSIETICKTSSEAIGLKVHGDICLFK